MKNSSFFPLLAALLVAGCSAMPIAATPESKASLQIQPQILAGGYSVQGDIQPYIPADVDHLVVRLFSVDASSSEHLILDSNSAPVQKILASTALNQSFSFSHLKMNTTYRLKAVAYDIASQSISPTCSLDVPVLQDDTPTVGTLLVTLSNKVFNGQGTSSITLATGSVVNSTESEWIGTCP